VTLPELFKNFDPLMVRYFIAASHYRSVVDFNENVLRSAEVSLKRLHQTVQKLRELKLEEAKPSGKKFEEFRRRFCQAMDDDFSSPQALAALYDLNREANNLLSEKNPDPEAVADAEHLFSSLGGDVLGIIPESIQKSQSEQNMNEVMGVLVELRASLREKKDFESADLIRDHLQKIGIVFKDTQKGTTWEIEKNN
jgi:cysteinyl-tRNA synthetase